MSTVLLVEDEAIIRLDLAEALKVEGFGVLEASDAETGLALFHNHATVQGAVVDIHLPGSMNGYDLVREIRSERPDVMVIIMSGEIFKPPDNFDEHVIVEQKPCDVRKIAHILRDVMRRQKRKEAGNTQSGGNSQQFV